MPPTPNNVYWTALSGTALTKLRNDAESELNQRAKHFGKTGRYYDGNHDKPLKPPSNGSKFDDNVLINVTKQDIDQTVSLASGLWPSIELDDGSQVSQGQAESAVSADTEKVISDFWKSVGEATWLALIMQVGCLTGHNFVLVVPRSDMDEYPRLVTLNPANMLCYWSDDDYETARWYEQRYFGMGEKRKRDYLSPGLDDNPGWQLRTYHIRGNNWELIEGGPDDLPVIDWPYDNPPIIDWQHLPRLFKYYGADEVNIDGNDSINKVASDMKKILRHYASPRIFGAGFAARQVEETAIEAFHTVEDPNAKVMMLEMASDMASSFNYLNLLLSIDRLQARVTILDGGPDAFKGVTNLGIKAAFMNQLAKTETIHRQYGKAIARLTVAALEMMNISIEEPLVKWQPPLPTSDMEETQVAQTQIDMGLLSKQGASSELGIDYEVEQQRIDEEGNAAGTALDKLMQQAAPFNTPQDNMRMQQQNLRGNGNG